MANRPHRVRPLGVARIARMSQKCSCDSRLLPPKLTTLQERQDSLAVDGGIVPVHPMPCVRHHHLRLTLEAAFEFRRDEEEYRRASLSRH